DVVEDVHRQLLGSLSAVGHAKDQREDDSMRALIQDTERAFVAAADVLDELDPFALGCDRLGRFRVQDVAKRSISARVRLLPIGGGWPFHRARFCCGAAAPATASTSRSRKLRPG